MTETSSWVSARYWKSPKQFHDGIDQLLGYTVWRDTKAALLLFIKKGEPTQVIAKADEVIRAHPCFRRAAPPAEPEVRRDYLLTSRLDPSRLIKTALLPIVVMRPGVADDGQPS
jgi:hypothetical protein